MHSGGGGSARAGNSVFTLPLVGRVGARSQACAACASLAALRRGGGRCCCAKRVHRLRPPPPTPPHKGEGSGPSARSDNAASTNETALIHADLRGADHLAPALGLLPDEGARSGRRAAEGAHAHGAQVLRRLGLRQRRVSLATIGPGIFGGAASAFQVSERKSFTPASSMVGTSGTDAMRAAVVTASILTFPARYCSRTESNWKNSMSMLPATRSFTACAVPR